MFWLYFAREYYRLANQKPQSADSAATPNITRYRILNSQIATIAYGSAAKREPVAAKAPAPVVAPEVTAEAAPAQTPETAVAPVSAHSWLQRLSVEGDHAFGIWDSEAGFSLFSANFERVTGLASGECAGHDWIHAVHHDQQYAINEALLHAEKGHDGACLLQACTRYGEENWRWLLVDIKAPTARQPHVMVLWRDLSEQKALEETLKQVESSLAMSERGRSAFLSSMSHELRTPLNAIMGFSEMMKSGVFGPIDNPTYAQYAEHIHESGATLLGKVNDLLDIASMDAGGLELDEMDFPLAELLNEVISVHSHQAFRRFQQLKLDCPLALTVQADRAKLLCALSHFMGNALRHSNDAEDITLSVRVQPDDGVIISVRDTGEGIPPAQLDIIRTALEADVAYFNIESNGIGLGLSLAKELAGRHEGRVMIDSIRHRGTVVSLILPISRVVRVLPVKKRSLQPA